MNGLTAYALSKKYTEQSLLGAGALKGEKGDDGASIKAISITQDSTGRITDAIATLSDNSTIKIEIISEIPPEERLDGDGSEYYTLAPAALSFRSTAPLNELQEVQINGVTVDPANYTLAEGSTIVTFPIDYLKTLDTGNYEVVIASESKSVKGEFTVKAPELNEHGFYYNQPYTAYVAYFGENETVFIREGGILDIIGTPSGDVSQATYSVNGNIMNIVSPIVGALTGTISDDGSEVFINELATSFRLSSDDSVVADEDYIYIYNEDLGGYEVNAIDKTKVKYGDIKTGINGINTVKLANDMFYLSDLDKISLMTVAPKIPDSVTTIGNGAFCECENLVSITIPSSVTSIGDYVFRCCYSLASITIPDSVTSIGLAALYNCSSLTSITIPDSVTSTGDYAFAGCKSLASITIGNGMTSIGEYAFDGCSSLESVVIPSSIIAIGRAMFSHCTSLASVVISDGITTIGDNAFFNCESLTSVIIPDSVTSIGKSAFGFCESLTSITIPDSVTSIGAEAFRHCENLASIKVAEGNNNYCDIDGNLFSKDKKTLVQYAIGKSDEEYIVPDSVTSIGEGAFDDCRILTSVIIPSSVTTIEKLAYEGCRNLSSITFNGTISRWNSITKGDWWNLDVPAVYVQCTDGTVSLV